MAAESQKPIREFDINTSLSFLEERIIDALKPPTRKVADLYRYLGPDLWYGEAFKGNHYSDEFKTEYLRVLKSDAKVNNPYSYLDSSWVSKPITNKRVVYDSLGEISGYTLTASNLIRAIAGRDNAALEFAEYLRNHAGLCLAGDFDGMMKLFIEQNQSFPVSWHFALAETYNDPMRVRPVPQSSLHLRDKASTNNASDMLLKLKTASGQLSDEIGYRVVPREAQIVVANVLMLSGYLAEISAEKSRFEERSGFNLPNDPILTDKTLIVIFKGRIADKNQLLSPKLQAHLGITSDPIDLMTLVTGHEHAHGYHEQDELLRYGLLNQAARELMANDLAATLIGSENFFDHIRRRFIRGMFAYTLDDVGERSMIIKDPNILGTININSLMDEVGDYGLGGLIILKEAIDANAIKLNEGKPATINHQKLFEQAKDRFLELSDIARNGDPDKTKRFFTRRLSGLRLFPVAQPQAIAS